MALARFVSSRVGLGLCVGQYTNCRNGGSMWRLIYPARRGSISSAYRSTCEQDAAIQLNIVRSCFRLESTHLHSFQPP